MSEHPPPWGFILFGALLFAGTAALIAHRLDVGEPSIARAGEWITRAGDNSKVCRLTRDLSSGFEFGPGDCDAWTEPAPTRGQWIAGSPAAEWVGCVPGHCRLHFAEGWRG